MSQIKKIPSLFIAVAIVALSIGVFTQISGNKQPTLPEFNKVIILPNPKTLTDAAFTDHLGQPFGLEQMRGKWNIVFFGFTNCPDICPTTMKTLSDVKKKVAAAGHWNNYQVIMISVDPERDTTELLANYVPYFDPKFIGLSSDLESTRVFAKQLGIIFVKREEDSVDNKSADFYQVDHSASIILINPQGQWAGAITAPHKPEEISDDLIKLAIYSNDLEPYLSNGEPSAKTPHRPDKTPISDVPEHDKRSLSIIDAWVRPAPPNVSSMAAYFELVNNSDTDITLVEIESSSFDHAMLHDTKTKDGLATMQHIDKLTIPANSSISLEPLGKHLMLMRPETPLDKGQSTEISLIAEDGRVFTFDILVREQPLPIVDKAKR